MKTAEQLDTLFTNLGKRFDQYSGSVSKTVGDTLQSSLARWQDFYYSGTWPDNELLRWEAAYNTASQMLDASIASGIKAKSANVAAASVKKKLDAVLVTGGDPLSMPDLRLPSQAVFLLAAAPLAWLLYKGR